MRRVWKAVSRGAKRRCPNCGVGPLFERWMTTHDRCSACGLRFQRNYGDTWAFWILSDRIPIAAGIVLLYFGFRAESWLEAALFLLAMVVPLVLTMPHRQGMAIALDYVSRVYLRDPSDHIPGLDDDPEDRSPLTPTAGRPSSR